MDKSVNNVIHVKQEPLEIDDVTSEQPQNKQSTLTADVRLLDQFCRLCLRQLPDLVPLVSCIRDMSVPEVFREITGLELILTDTYPLKTCLTCMAMLDYALAIRQNFTESYQILIRFLLTKTQPLVSHLSEYQDGVRATSDTLAERMLPEYRYLRSQEETVDQHTAVPEVNPCGSIPQPQEELVELVELVEEELVESQIKQEPELILEPEELPNHLLADKVFEEGRHACSYCDKKLPSEADLVRHKRIHTGKKPYQCNACDKSFRSSRSLKEHAFKIHPKSEEVNDGTVLTCKFEGCGFSTTKMRYYYLHKAKHELKLQCTECSQRFASGQELRKHQHVHTGVKYFSCKQCDKSFQSKQSLQEHVASHNNDRPFACEICGMDFVRKRTLTQHMCKHSAQLSFECRNCGVKFRYRAHRARHEKRCKETAVKLIDLGTDVVEETTAMETETINFETMMPDPINQEETAAEAAPKLIPSVIILEQQEDKLELLVQIKREPELILESEELPTVAQVSTNSAESSAEKVDNMRNLDLQNKLNPNKCYICSKLLTSTESVEAHISEHLDMIPYVCKSCTNETGQELKVTSVDMLHSHFRMHVCASLSAHISKKLTNYQQMNDGRIRTCKFDGCDFSTTNMNSYYNHKAKHDLRFQCPECSQRFAKKQQLQRHEFVHTGVKNFSCEQCDKSFQSKQSLMEHVAYHSNDCPFGCGICGMAFVHKRILKQHMFKHDTQPAFECRYCGMKFRYRTSHAGHEKMHLETAEVIDPDAEVAEETTATKTETIEVYSGEAAPKLIPCVIIPQPQEDELELPVQIKRE